MKALDSSYSYQMLPHYVTGTYTEIPVSVSIPLTQSN